MEKICKKHGLTEYALRKDGRLRCKKCSVDAVQKRREQIKLMSVDYKGGKCEICGYCKCVNALEFHHVDENKDFGIGEKGYTRSWDKVKKELDKCMLLCSNCHRETHHNDKKTSNIIPKKNITMKKCDCGKIIDNKANMCRNCYNLKQRKVDRPPLDVLLNEINELGYTKTGKKIWCF